MIIISLTKFSNITNSRQNILFLNSTKIFDNCHVHQHFPEVRFLFINLWEHLQTG